jgi:hypothetical protein
MIETMRKGREDAGERRQGAPQRGGDFVLNCARTFQFVNRMYSFHDRPKLADLLTALRQVLGAGTSSVASRAARSDEVSGRCLSHQTSASF